MTEAHALAGFVQQIGGIAHALHTIGNDNIGLASLQRWAAPSIMLFIPEPHSLFTVVAGTDTAMPAPMVDCLAGS